MPEFIAAGLLFLAVAALSFHNLGGAPAPWHDEGAALTLARTLAREGIYGIRATTGIQTFGAVQSLGPTVILPGAWLLRRCPADPAARLGHARKLGGVYTLITCLTFYLVARQLFGWPCAAWSVFFLLSGRCVDYVRLGRMFQGEVPALGFFLAGWLALAYGVSSHSFSAFALSGLLFGGALLTKSTYVVGLTAAALGTVGIASLTGRQMPWPGLLLSASLSLACHAAWRLWLYRSMGPELFRENARKMRELSGTLAGFAIARNLKNLIFIIHPESGSFFYLFGVVGWLYGLRLAWQAPDDTWLGLTFLLFFMAGYLTFLILSLPLLTYLMPATAIGALFVARLWLNIGSSGWPGFILAGVVLVLSLRDLITVLKVNVFARATNACKVAQYLESMAPSGTVIETWEREVGFLSDHSFNYPDESCLVQAHTQRYAGGSPNGLAEAYFLQARPDWVILGPMSRWHGIYDQEYLVERSAPIATFGYGDQRYEILRWLGEREREGRPIWVLGEPSGAYLTEILAGEGLNLVTNLPVSALERLHPEVRVILLASSLTHPTQSEQLLAFVRAGGMLTVFRPVAELRPLCGLGAMAETVAQGWMRIRPESSDLAEFTQALLPIETHADVGELTDAESLADLLGVGYEYKGVAVARRRLGKGCVISWAYDLSANIARLRQGDPGRVRARTEFQRAADLFAWREGETLELPRADEQQRLLVHLLLGFQVEAGFPLPRLWYFPDAAESVLVATGDAHAASAATVESVVNRVEMAGGRFSVYYAFSPLANTHLRTLRSLAYSLLDYLPLRGSLLRRWLSRPSPNDFERWRHQGHEVGLHPYLERGLEAGLADALADHLERGKSALSVTMRAHCVQWFGWSESARAQAKLGVQMNLDFYHWGLPHQTDDGRWVAGFLTDSGLPLRFVDERGEVLPIFQQLTNLVDEHVLGLGWEEPGRTLEQKKALDFLEEVFQRCIRWNGVVAGQFHVDPFGADGVHAMRAAAFLDAALTAAQRLGLPILSAAQWCQFNQARRQVRFESLRWTEVGQGLDLEFSVRIPAQCAWPLSILLPESHSRKLAALTINGTPDYAFHHDLRGQTYACLLAGRGHHQVTAHFAPQEGS